MASRRPRTSRRTPSVASTRRADVRLSRRVNRELYKRNAELAIRNKTLALLQKLDEISMATLGVEEMTREMSTAIAQELGFELVSIAILDKPEALCRWLGAASLTPAIASVIKGLPVRALAVPLAAKKNVCVRMLRRKRPQILPDALSALPPALADVFRGGKKTRRVALRSSLVYPLRLGTRALGILVVSSLRDLRDLSRYEHEALAGIVALIAIAIEKAQIYSELQETSANLREANQQLAQLDKAKSEFLSIASHQLYTPLTALRGYLSMLQEGDFGAIPEKQRDVMGILRASSDRLIALIRNLLDISRIESGRLELSSESVDLVAMTRELVTELVPNAARKRLVLTFHEPVARVPHVVADAQRVRQVLLNCLDNAIKYTDTGRIDVRVDRSGHDILYTVQDTGRGMAPEDLRRVFGKFVRVGGGAGYRMGHRTEGTGLGLFVARQIVREHRGDIWVESPGSNKGSTFFVKLPAEGTPYALRVGEKFTVGIKATEVGQRAEDLTADTVPAGGQGSAKENAAPAAEDAPKTKRAR